MQAWADGLNYYLATHPEVRPRVLTRFEPWMALSFTEGSIGGDIERCRSASSRPSTASATVPMTDEERGLVLREPTGSNGIAIAPSHTRNGHALLLINPHTSFFFRSEQQVTSGEGLNVYGAATWGQFFIYQGFNAHTGWMHTSSGVDNVDEFAETIVTGATASRSYRYGNELRPVTTKTITLSYRTAKGGQARAQLHHVRHPSRPDRARGGRQVDRVRADEQARRGAAAELPAHQDAGLRAATSKVAGLKANSSNNTLFADSKGEIAFLMPQFMPIRDDRFDYRKPVDGSDPATDWHGLHSLDSMPQAVNPKNGWAFNTNNWPWTAAGADSPKAADFPRYLDQVGENPRGPQAIRVLTARDDFTPQTLIAGRVRSVPHRLRAAGAGAGRRVGPTARGRRAEGEAGRPDRPAARLGLSLGRGVDRDVAGRVLGRGRCGRSRPRRRRTPGMSVWDYMADRATDAQRLAALETATERLTQDFGSWQVPWGEINRFQRNDGAIVQKFRRCQAEHPGALHLVAMGLPRLVRRQAYPGTKRYYGTSGNSFVAVVEFGPRAARLGGDGGRGERASRLAALQRPGRTLRERRPAARLLLSR